METVSLNKDKLLKAFEEGNDSDKKLLKRLFPDHVVPGKITDRVKTFKDACEVLGYEYDEEAYEDFAPDVTAYRKLKVIVKALNEGWEPNWNNESQYKWYPWFYMNKPGFRFLGAYCAITTTGTAGGSRLCFNSEELAKYAGKQFLDIYEKLMA